ncbi:MAG: ABC transporter ATP-binding protein [bacterium]
MKWRICTKKFHPTALNFSVNFPRVMKIDPSIKRFLSYAKPYKWWIIGATICGLLKYNIPIIFPWVLKDVINHLLDSSSPQIAFINKRIIALFLIYILWAFFTFYRSFLADQAGQMLVFDLRHELFVHLQRMSLGFYEKRKIGSIASRLLSDIAIAQNFVGAAFTNTIMDASSIVLITAALFYMNWRLALVSILIFPVYVIFNKFFKKRILTTSRLAQQKMEEISGQVHEKLEGISTIQSYTREKAEENNFFNENRAYLFYRIANIKNNALAAAIIGFLTSIAPVVVVWYGAMQVIQGYLTVGELAAFYAYLGMFYQPLNRLTDLNILLANSQSAIERIFDIFNTSPEIIDTPNSKEIVKMKGKIQFYRVSFGYDPSLMILKDISLDVSAGNIVALVGRSGSGKSTFVKLIPRFYDVAEGSINIDDVDVRNFRLISLRRKIALVPQEPVLFSGSIYENILMGKPDSTEEEVKEAAISANAHDFIVKMAHGYQMDIGEGGVRLSGGQKQRISLARAFLKNAPILILDEATSSLDSESENLIQDALKRLMKGRTTFIIAHRLSTIQSADTIIVFESGRILEKGNHKELVIKRNGIYRRLYEEQFKNFFPE